MNKGILFALLAGILSGFTIFYNKVIVVSGIDPLMLNILKNGGAAIFLALFLVPKWQQIKLLKKRDYFILSLIAIVGGSIPFLLFFEGLRTVPAVSANLIQKSMFLWVGVLALPLLKEKLSKSAVAAYILLLIALIAPSLRDIKFGLTSGYVMIFAATLLWSLEYILVKKALKHIHPNITSFARLGGGVLILLFIALFKFNGTIPPVSPHLLLPIAGTSIFLAAYVTLIHRALVKIPATTTASLLTIAPVVTLLLQTTFLNSTFTAPSLVMSTVTIIGIYLILKNRTHLEKTV